MEHRVERLDGAPTPECLPKTIIKPEDLGFGNGTCKILDFGFSFHYTEGAAIEAEQFSRGMTKAIEFETNKSTVHPFKVDSWYLGQLVSNVDIECCLFYLLIVTRFISS